MTQLYVGNLSEHGDEKNIRNVFGKYGTVREVLMKNGYAFVEMDNHLQAEHVMRELNGTDILGNPMIVEPSHQQRLSSSRRRNQLGIVEVSNIPTHMTLEAIENFFNHTIGQVVKIEIEDNQPSDFGAKRVLVSFDTLEQAQRAAMMYTGEENMLKCTVLEEHPGQTGVGVVMKNMRRTSIPGSPGKGNNEFPLRILVPSEMVGAIIGKDGLAIRHITTFSKARVDVHRRENLGSMEKAITIIGTPEACTEACHHIMRIMQNELLATNGSIFDNGKHHFEPLPVVPLKILAHNELIGRVIGKGGNTLKRIMSESGTKITISKIKDLTAYNMERTVTVLGTIDNCKKAESLISAKLRASYESDMTQFMNSTSDSSPSDSPPHSRNPLTCDITKPSTYHHPQSLPTTPTAMRTYQDFSTEHTRLTTLYGSTGALEVNGLGGFFPQPPPKLGTSVSNGDPPLSNGTGYNKMNSYDDPGLGVNPLMANYGEDDLSDVFQGLSLKDPYNMYGRTSSAGFRRSSAPTQSSALGWPGSISEESAPIGGGHHSSKLMGHIFSSASSGHSNSVVSTTSTQPPPPSSQTNNSRSIWSPTFSSRPESELSSYSEGSNNGFSPIYSPVTAVTTGFFEPFTSSAISSSSTATETVTNTEVKSTPIPSTYGDLKTISVEGTASTKPW